MSCLPFIRRDAAQRAEPLERLAEHVPFQALVALGCRRRRTDRVDLGLVTPEHCSIWNGAEGRGELAEVDLGAELELLGLLRREGRPRLRVPAGAVGLCCRPWMKLPYTAGNASAASGDEGRRPARSALVVVRGRTPVVGAVVGDLDALQAAAPTMSWMRSSGHRDDHVGDAERRRARWSWSWAG